MEQSNLYAGQGSGGREGAGLLKIFTLGRFQLCLGERRLFDHAGRAHKTGDLLMYLITNRGKHIPPDTIMDTIWPEHDYSDPRNVLKNMIYRLKHSFEEIQVPGAKALISYSYGGYGWNVNAPYWLDADAFESLSQVAHGLIKVDPLQAAARYREALALYHGHYLPECQDVHWVLPKRYYYRRLFVRSVSELLAFQKEQRLFSDLVEDAEWALSIESFDESINIFYMEALLEEGKTARARDHYEYITALNYYENGSRPSPAMQKIYKAIQRQSDQAALDFNDLRRMLSEKDADKGPLLCDPDTFRLLCRLEKRRAERDNRPVQLGLLTVMVPGLQTPLPEQLKPATDCLRGILLEKLRRADVISLWNEYQFIVFLPGLAPDQAEALLKRITAAFKDRCLYKDITLKSSVHSFLPPEMTATQ